MDRGQGNDPPYRRGADAMTDDDLSSLVASAITDAIKYVEEELGPDRVEATNYYHGKPLGNEVEGRSRAQMTEVRDGITGAIPGLIRLLHGPEHVVEFVPRRADAVAGAEQATDYARFVYEEDNGGLLVTHSVLKDGLLKKIGIVKWGMDETQEVKTTAYANLTREDIMLLGADEANELTVTAQNLDGTYNIEVRRTEAVGRIWVKAVPPDDFFWNREARCLDEAILVGHRDRLTKGQLLQMGVSEADIDEYGGAVADGPQTLEEQARREVSNTAWGADVELGEANRRYVYCEVLMMLDMGQGVELRRCCTLGDAYHVIKNQPAEDRNFAVFSPDPEPHAFLGGSWYDRLKDLQRINSSLLRGFLDSLSVSLFPRPVYVDGQASVADIMNNAIGAPVRERLPNMVRWDNIPFAGDKVLPALTMMREVVERRIGQKDGAMSLDMDALQSTGKEAVQAAIVAAQSQSELLGRLYAEQVMKPMFRGILKLAARPESKERIVRLRGKYVPVQPGTWDANMDVSVAVALGSMNTEKKAMVMQSVIEDQAAILHEYGPQNPVVTLAMLRDAKAKLLTLNGIKDVESYYLPVDPNWQPPPPPPPEPTPDQLWIQAEKEMAFQKAMKELAIKQDELALEGKRLEAETALKHRELQMREEEAAAKIAVGPHNAEIERYKADKEAELKALDIASREQMEREKLALEREKMLLDAETKRYAADKQAEAAKDAAKQAPQGGMNG